MTISPQVWALSVIGPLIIAAVVAADLSRRRLCREFRRRLPPPMFMFPQEVRDHLTSEARERAGLADISSGVAVAMTSVGPAGVAWFAVQLIADTGDVIPSAGWAANRKAAERQITKLGSDRPAE